MPGAGASDFETRERVKTMADLAERLSEIVAAVGRQGLLVYPGYVAEDLPTVWWQSNPDQWPDFLGIAKAEGVRTLFVGRATLEAATRDAEFLRLYDVASQGHDAARSARNTWWTNHFSHLGGQSIAYFSA